MLNTHLRTEKGGDSTSIPNALSIHLNLSLLEEPLEELSGLTHMGLEYPTPPMLWVVTDDLLS